MLGIITNTKGEDLLVYYIIRAVGNETAIDITLGDRRINVVLPYPIGVVTREVASSNEMGTQILTAWERLQIRIFESIPKEYKEQIADTLNK